MEAGQLAAYDGVMPLQQLAPRRIADRGRPLGRADDVREEDGGQDALRLDSSGELRDEPRRQLHRRKVSLVVDPREDAPEGRQLGELCSLNPRRDVVARSRTRGMRDDQRGDAHRGEDVLNIELHCSARRR